VPWCVGVLVGVFLLHGLSNLSGVFGWKSSSLLFP
jgi:hypothetical protein